MPQEECLAATSASLDDIQQLHESIPIEHAFKFPPAADMPVPPLDPPPLDAPVPASPPLRGTGEAFTQSPPKPPISTTPVDANPPAGVEEDRSHRPKPAALTFGILVIARIALLQAT